MKKIESDTNLVFQNFTHTNMFAGVVESIADPLMQGRVQVRCIGYHPDSKTLVPTIDLPWAHVMLPTTSAGVSGIGATHGLVDGSWVIGFFSDGREAQQPIVMGSIAGNPVPSRIQQPLLDSGQSISATPSDGVAGLTQSASISSVGAVSSTSSTPSATDAAQGSIDLSSVSSLVSSGLVGSTVQNNTLLNVISSTNDLRASQIYSVISNNEKLNTSSAEGASILAYITKYSTATLASLLGITDTSNLNVNPKAGTVDVNTNYEKSNDTSTTQAGLILIQHNSVRKSAAALDISKFNNISDYHFVISAQGQIFPKGALSSSIKTGDNLESIVSMGTTSNTIRICLIGGLPDDKTYDSTAGFNERFTVAQMNAAKRLITSLLKKYPKAVIDGSNNLTKDGSGVSPNFDVASVFKDNFPNNVNISSTGTPVITGTTSIPATTQFDNITPTTTAFHDPRAVLPAINYGQDYSVIGRYNGVTNTNRLPPVIAAIAGNLTKFSTHEPRNASDRTAVGVNTPAQIPTTSWGGEYGHAHVIHETPGGHAVYADDTPGKNRLILSSPTGSVIEMGPTGRITIMSQEETYLLSHGDLHVVTNGDLTETINGHKKVKINGDYVLEVGGRMATVSAGVDEFTHGNKSSVTEGFFKQHTKAGHFIEVGKDYNLEIGGNQQNITAGTVVDQAGLSRSTVTTGGHTIKSNNTHDITLGNRNVMTKGDMFMDSNGKSVFSAQGDMNMSTAGNMSSAATGSSKTFGATTETTASGKMSLNSSSLGIQSSGSMTFDGSAYKFDEGTQADKTNPPTILQFPYPVKLQPVSPVSSPESNPSASDMVFGQRHEMEAHDEMGNNPGTTASRGSTNSGATSNDNSPAGASNAAKSNLDTVSLGGQAASGCTIANGLVTRGMTPEAASAYAGGFMQESSLNPTTTNSIGAYGLAQWTSSGNRKQMMLDYTGSRSATVDGQLDYVLYELTNNPNGVAGGAATTWKTDNLADAIKSAANYERFNGYTSASQGVYNGSEWGSRAGYAASIYKTCFNKDPSVFNPVASFNANAGSLNSTATNTNSSSPNTGVGPGPDTRGSEKNVDLPPMSTKYTDRNQKISEFFTLADVLKSGTSKFDMPEYLDLPNGRLSADDIVANLSKVCTNVLDPLSRKFGKVVVHSGLRPPWYNKRIGGAKNSQHMYGRACDITIPGMTPAQVHAYVLANIPAAHGVGSYPTFTHVDVRPQAGVTTWSG